MISVLGPSRCYESLKKICSQLNQLQHSENINSITMRKYTATLSQVIDLNQNQLDWVCKHLGHTKRIHKEHYQQMSGFIERVQISKLLLVQDLNLTKKYAGKKLDDITFEDVLMTGANANENENEGDVDNSLFENATQVPTVSTSKRPYHDAESSDDDDEMPVRKRKKCKSAKRIRWTSEQIKEIEKHFKTHLEQKTTPGKNECVKVQKSSELLRLKHYTDIVKKISNINHKK